MLQRIHTSAGVNCLNKFRAKSRNLLNFTNCPKLLGQAIIALSVFLSLSLDGNVNTRVIYIGFPYFIACMPKMLV